MSLSASGFILSIIISYMTYVRHWRYQRIKALEGRFNSVWEEGRLSPEQAQEILQTDLFYEHPLMIQLGTRVALFKVYALPNFANLLVKTGQLKSSETISKRIADTATLISTWLTCPLVRPGTKSTDSTPDPRGAIAIARVNFLHGKYPIENDDMLYNLALFIKEPMDWVMNFGWRKPSEMEYDAIFIFWKEIGDKMGIKDIWETKEEMLSWVKDFEEMHIIPTKNAHLLADTTLNFFLQRFPAIFGIRHFFKNVILSFLDDRSRRAMGFTAPPPIFTTSVPIIFKLQALLVRHFCLPRRYKSLYVTMDGPSNIDASGKARMHAVYRRPIPWYWPESKGLRRVWENFLVSYKLRDPATLPGRRWKSEGYRLEELGPTEFENLGRNEVLEAAGVIQGTPVVMPWGL